MNTTLLSIFGICFIFFMTCLGASIIFLIKRDIKEEWKIFLLSFAGGIMFASSIWSLIIPAIDSSIDYGKFAFLPAGIGILLGGLFMWLLDFFLEKSQKNNNDKKSYMSANKKMFLALTLHNVPEGLSVGVAIGSALVGSSMSMIGALSLAIGIGIQNIPEGLAVSLPMHQETGKRGKAFFYGVLSGILEPMAAIVGLLLSSFFTTLLPWLLAFAGGTMIYTILNELMPETQTEKSKLRGTWGFIFGFLIMMILDVAFA